MFKYSHFKMLKDKGFTLVEVLTSVTVFTFLMVAALGIYSISITKHRQVLESQVVNEDLKYVMELMSRDIKEGSIMASSTDGKTIYIDHPTKNVDDATCIVGNYSGCLQYQFNSVTSCLEIKGKSDTDFVALTSSRVIVEKVDFSINAAVGDTKDQPIITILIKAKAKDEKGGTSEMIVQTMINQRQIENSYQGAI